MGIFDWLKKSPPSFKSGPLKTPTKFSMKCTTCPDAIACTMEIPSGRAEPTVLVKCGGCGKAESLYVI